MRNRSPGYSASLERKKQYSQSRLQIGPVGLASTWNCAGAVNGRGSGRAGAGRPASSRRPSDTGTGAMATHATESRPSVGRSAPGSAPSRGHRTVTPAARFTPEGEGIPMPDADQDVDADSAEPEAGA